MAFIAGSRLRVLKSLLVSFTLSATALAAGPITVAGSGSGASLIAASTLVGRVSGPFVGEKVRPHLFSGSVRDLPTAPPGRRDVPATRQSQGKLFGGSLRAGADASTQGSTTSLNATSISSGPSSAAGVTPSQFANATPNRDGIGYTQVVPPDPNGAPGRNQYIQIINSQFEIFDKQLNSLAGPTNINQLWVNAGDNGACATNNSGDPVVLYDHLADRWLISQFAIPNGFSTPPTYECIAISRTTDPVNGGWFVYTFQFAWAFDYPKLGLWPDAYYMSSQEGFSGGSLDVYAFDRANMLNGNPATYQRFTVGSPALIFLPGDLSGPPPPMGTPNTFARAIDGGIWGGSTRIELWEFHTDWNNPAVSTFTHLPDLGTSFSSNLCGQGGNLNADCAPQPTTTQTLETLPHWSMGPLQYRTFGSYESLVFNHTVAGPGANQAAPRWYELRKSAGTWSIVQENTYAPDTTASRWMGSIAMDKAGDLALGYSISDASTINPGIRYVGRLVGDPLGTMSQGEFTLVNGQGQQIANGDRWGDYSAMRVDPADGCTFWYTSQYIGTLGLVGPPPTGNAWNTRIGAFRFPTCNPADLALADSVTPDPGVAGTEETWDLNVTNLGPDTATKVVLTETLPAGASFQTSSVACSRVAQTLTCQLGTMTSGQSTNVDIQALIDPFLDSSSGGPITIADSASVTSDQLDPNLANNTASAPVAINELADLQTTKSCDASVLAGQSGNCTIYIDNNGPSAARAVNLTDTASSNGTFTMASATTSQGTCSGTPVTGTSATLSCSLGTLRPASISGPGRATIVVRYTANEGQTINDVATASSPTPDPISANNQATASLPITATSDLQITSTTATPSPVIAGNGLTFSVTVRNNGPSTAQTVVLSESLPTGVAVQSVTAPGATKCNVGTPGNSLDPATCGFDVLGPGASAMMTIVTQVLPATTGTLHSDASVTSGTFDPNNSNNFAHTDTTVMVQADIALGMSSSPNPVAAGTAATIVSTVMSAGPSLARNVTLSVMLPTGTAFISYQISNGGAGTCALVVNNPRQLACQLNDLAPGQAVMVYTNIAVDPSQPAGPDQAGGSASTSSNDPNLSNNSAMTILNVITRADLSAALTTTDGSHVYHASTSVTYVGTAANAGPSDAQSAQLVFTLPGGKVGNVVSNNGGCLAPIVTNTSTTVTCQLGTLPAGVSRSIQVQFFIQGNKGTLNTSDTVSSTTSDPNFSNNSASWSVGPK